MLDDSTLVQRCQNGQKEYLDVLVQRYQTPLYTMCRKLTRAQTDADGLFQDTWVRALKALGRFSPEKPFLTWLLTICINLYRDRYRKRKSWRRRILGFSENAGLAAQAAQVGSSSPGPDSELIQKETKALVHQALDQLDDDHRLPLLLYYFRQMKVAEIAEVLRIPAGTVKSRLANGRQKLGIIIEEVGHERP